MNKFEVHEYEEDLDNELKRMTAMKTKNPYVKDWPRKLKQPEYAIVHARNVGNLQLLYLTGILGFKLVMWVLNIAGWLKEM